MKNVSAPIWLPPSTSRPNQVLLSTGVGSNVKWGNVAAQTGSGSSGGLPAGVIMDYAGSSVPSGWLLCNGASVSSATYPAL